MFVDVALPKAPAPLTYAVPDGMERFAAVGMRVRVPVRRRAATGVVVAVADTTGLDAATVRAVTEVLDTDPVLPPHLLELARFVASYYRAPLGATLAAMLPPALLRTDREEVELTTRGAGVDPAALPAVQRRLLADLQGAGRLGVATLLARSGAASRSPLEALLEAGLARTRHRRRDHAPEAEVAAIMRAPGDLDGQLEAVGRAPRQRALLEWLAELGRPAYLAEAREAVGCSPSVIRGLEEKGLLSRFTQKPARRPIWRLPQRTSRIEPTAEQAAAVAAVRGAVHRGGFAPFLLEGVTGSGKTEVYLRCLEAVLERGGSGIVLVPEIGLTPAASGAVEARFGSQAAVLHSAQSEGDRWREWRSIRDGRVRVVVGPRSALFAPLRQLGMIVVDEEQDSAYKQAESPRYHARDLALVLGQRLGIPVLLCSATPSVEAAALVERGLAERLVLSERVAGGTLPSVELVDLRGEPPDPGEQGRTLLSRRLGEAVDETLGRGEQVILLMHRRGWAPQLLCRDCGHRVECPDCSVSMVVHRRSGDLRCHYCGRRAAAPATCPACHGDLLDPVGAGTEKVADNVMRRWPDVPVGILDRDTVRRRDGLEEVLGAFAAGELRILVGTQMVAKGHHFPAVTLTGVISADALLALPDFRAGERTFQLLTQVAGRAGRGERPGRVVIQTYHPENPAVRHASRHDVRAFLADELRYRQAFGYPPAVRMAVVRYESKDGAAARGAAEDGVSSLGPLPDNARLRGPAPAPIERIRGHWRWQLLVSASNRDTLRGLLERAEDAAVPRTVRRVVDVDPLSTL